MSEILTAYFSASGVTAAAAKKAAAAVGADLYEIRPETPYTKQDLNWMNPFSRSTKEMRGKVPYPALADHDADIEGHSLILLGFPIWWFSAPTIINNFLESYDFKGKRIIIFATSGGSGFGKTAEKLRAVADCAELSEGKILNSQTAIDEFVAQVLDTAGN